MVTIESINKKSPKIDSSFFVKLISTLDKVVFLNYTINRDKISISINARITALRRPKKYANIDTISRKKAIPITKENGTR